MANFEEELNELLERTKTIKPPTNVGIDMHEKNRPSTKWMNDVEIFYHKYLVKYALGNRIKTLLFHRNSGTYNELISCLESIQSDYDFIDKMNGATMKATQDNTKIYSSKYDVFISHANADKEELIDNLYVSLKKLGVSIFYDKESLKWGDKFKEKILEGVKKSEFAIIVISSNFFGREWTEKELYEFLNIQDHNGQKLILPIIHNITIEQLKEKYPSIADIQVIDSSKYSCDGIALLFAQQLITRLKAKLQENL